MTDYNDELQRSNSQLSHDLQKNDSITVAKATEYANQLIQNINSRRYNSDLLPNSVKEAIAMGEAGLIQNEFEFLKTSLNMVRQTQIQTLRENCNQHLDRMKATSRGDTARILADKIAEVMSQIDRTFDDFIMSLAEKLEKAESIRVAKVKDARIKQLERDLESFMELQKKLVNRVLSIASEGV